MQPARFFTAGGKSRIPWCERWSRPQRQSRRSCLKLEILTMALGIRFYGPLRYRVRIALVLCRSITEAFVVRTFKRRQDPAWNWFAEITTRILRRQLGVAFGMRDVSKARRYLDSFVITSTLPPLIVRNVVRPQFRGSWLLPQNANAQATVLYLHGGGYSFYPRGYADFIKQLALAANSRTFALDYRLSPEHRFPAQLEDALHCYRWLLENAAGSDALVVAGDSAGGNLTLALLLALRDEKIPPPALAIALSPATGLEGLCDCVGTDQHRDWIDQRMLEKWVGWFCGLDQLRDPRVSPVYADLRGLPPIYIQAGRAEILYTGIQAFVEEARKQGADVRFESWDNMTHVFQVFAPHVPQSVEALRRIGEVIRVGTGEKQDATGLAGLNQHVQP